MSSSAFHNLFDIKPASKVASPAPTYQKDDKKAPQSLRDVGHLLDTELDEITPSKARNEAQDATEPKGVQTPKTPNELERSSPPTPTRDEAVGLMRTWKSPPMTKWRILCCCLIYFANGMNDSGKPKHSNLMGPVT